MEKETSLAVDDDTLLGIPDTVDLPLPDFIPPSNPAPYEQPPPEQQQQQQQVQKTAPAGFVPETTRCAFCETTHPPIYWGSYQRTTKDLSELSFSKNFKALQPGTFICEAAYNYLIGLTNKPPTYNLFMRATGPQPEMRMLFNKAYVSLLSGSTSSGSFNGMTGHLRITPSLTSPGPSLNPSLSGLSTASKSNTLNEILHGNEPGPDIDKIVTEKTRTYVNEYLNIIGVYLEVESIVEQLVTEQKETTRLVAELKDKIQAMQKKRKLSLSPQPLPRKRVRNDVAQRIASFSGKVDTIMGPVNVVSSLETAMKAIKDDFDGMTQEQLNETDNN